MYKLCWRFNGGGEGIKCQSCVFKMTIIIVNIVWSHCDVITPVFTHTFTARYLGFIETIRV